MEQPQRGLPRAHAQPHRRFRTCRDQPGSEVQAEPEPHSRRTAAGHRDAREVRRYGDLRYGSPDVRARPRHAELANRFEKGREMKRAASGDLRGLRVLVGRARHQAGALSAELRRVGASVIEIPFIEIRAPRSFKPLDEALKNLDAYDWLILTSVNGVDAMWNRLQKLRAARSTVKRATHLKVAAIGPATKKALEKRRMTV